MNDMTNHAEPSTKRKPWIARHKILGGIGGTLIFLVVLGSLLPDEPADEPTAETSAPAPESTTPTPTAGSGSTEIACDEFAAHAKSGLASDQRSEVVSSIGEVIDIADPEVQEAYRGLARTVDGSDSSYRMAADWFAQSCFDAGWNG